MDTVEIFLETKHPLNVLRLGEHMRAGCNVCYGYSCRKDVTSQPWNSMAGAKHWLCLVCCVLVNSDILIANYSIKQRQFTKPTSELCASGHEESNEAFDRTIRGWSL